MLDLRLTACAVALLATSPAIAQADSRGGGTAAPGGGMAAPGAPVVADARCASGEAWACRAGQDLTLSGEELGAVRRVVFLGRKGGRDDRRAQVRHAGATDLVVRVPRNTLSGRIRVFGTETTTTSQRLRVLSGPAPKPVPATTDLKPGQTLVAGSKARATFPYEVSVPGAVEVIAQQTGQVVRSFPVAAGSGTISWDGLVDGRPVPAGQYVFRLAGQASAQAAASSPPLTVADAIFPIRGKHDLGQSPTNNFGGGRGHGGQDMFARCGTRLVAVRPGIVQHEAFQSRAGNYVVLQDAEGQSYAYMHMRDRSVVSKGERVLAGQTVGYVGETGRASGCHLHFELWTAPGWYTGGKAVDPLPELQRWDQLT